MANTIVLPQGTYPTGTRTLGPATVPQGISSAQLLLDGASMTNPALGVSITLDLSLDGGATWASEAPSSATDPFPVTATLNGGALNRAGSALANYSVGCILPSAGSTTRKIKATVTIAGTALTTQGTLVLN